MEKKLNLFPAISPCDFLPLAWTPRRQAVFRQPDSEGGKGEEDSVSPAPLRSSPFDI